VGVVTLKERPVCRQEVLLKKILASSTENTATNQAVNSRATDQQQSNNNTNSDDYEEDTHAGDDGTDGTNAQDTGTTQAHADTSDTQEEGEVEEEEKSESKGPTTKRRTDTDNGKNVPVEGNKLVVFPSLDQANIDNTTESRVSEYNNGSFDNIHEDTVEVNTLAIVPYTGTTDNNITLNHLVVEEVDANGSGGRR